MPTIPESFAEAWGDMGWRQALRQWAGAQYMPENIGFLEAIDAYNAAPSEAGAQAILDSYVVEGAASEINISGPLRAQIIEAGAEAPDADGLAEAQGQVWNMVSPAYSSTFSAYAVAQGWGEVAAEPDWDAVHTRARS